jgi:hypothetical protein
MNATSRIPPPTDRAQKWEHLVDADDSRRMTFQFYGQMFLDVLTVGDQVAANALRQVAAYASADSRTEFVVEYVAADSIVIDHGQGVAVYPAP